MPIITLVGIAITILTGVDDLVTRKQQETLLEQRGNTVLQGIENRLKDRQRTKEVFAQLLAETPGLAASVAEQDKVDIARMLVPLQARLGLGFIEVYGRNGEPLLLLGRGARERSEKPLTEAALSGLTQSVSQVGNGGLDVLAAAPIKGQQGITGAIIVGTTLDGDALQGVKDRDSVELAVFLDGSLITSTVTQSDIVASLAATTVSFERLPELHHLLDRFGFHTTGQQLDNNGLLVALIPTLDLAQAAQERHLVALIAAGVLVLALAVVGLLLARGVARPLARTVSVCREMASGDYRRRVPTGWIWELNELATGLNSLAQRVESQITQISHMAFHDQLTHLANRALFEDRLNLAIAQASRSKQMLAVMFLDLDQFKLINDSAGHATGDRLLVAVAERLSSLMREGDTVARMGGDEFALLLPQICRQEDVIAVAQRVLESFRRPWVLAGQEFSVTTSIGIAVYPTAGESPASLLGNADIAMYHAKDQGTDNYQFFTTAMSESLVHRVALERDMRQALEREEFVLHYQPQVNTLSGSVVGVEALVRWNHPVRGLLLPGDFIYIAEETGFIEQLGEWVLRTACVQNRAWLDAGLPSMRVAVNLSARQFQQPDLVRIVKRVLRETGLPPQYLELEITESTAMRDVDFSVMLLTDLREMGIHVSIDDFGTGHNSLSHLKRLPIDGVKIDRSFVHDIVVDPDDAAIVAAIISLGQALHLRVIAEGVEFEEQLAFLVNQQCHEAQGYLLSRPAPADEVESILAQRQPFDVVERYRHQVASI